MASGRVLSLFLWLGTIHVLSACATQPVYQDVQLPAYAGEYFSECKRGDGAVAFELNHDGALSDRIEAEWALRTNGDWSLASYSPFGQTLLQVNYQYQARLLQVTAKQATPLQKLAVDKKGFLVFEDHRLGLKADEIACFLEMKLPQAWLRQVVGQSQENDALVIHIQDSQRRILLRLGRHGPSQEWRWSAEFKWELYFGLRHESLVFQLLKGPRLVLKSQSFPEFSGQMTLNEEQM